MEALKGKSLHMNTKIDGVKLSDWIKSGALINSPVDGYAIPTLSPFFLQVFLKNQSQGDIFYQLLSKLAIEPQNSEMKWHEFEYWHTNWEIMMRYVYLGEEISYATLYHMETTELPVFEAELKGIRRVENGLTSEIGKVSFLLMS